MEQGPRLPCRGLVPGELAGPAHSRGSEATAYGGVPSAQRDAASPVPLPWQGQQQSHVTLEEGTISGIFHLFFPSAWDLPPH